MMKKNWKRTLASLLSAAVLMSTVTVSALAAEESEVSEEPEIVEEGPKTLQEAISSAAQGDTVTLWEDVEEEITVTGELTLG